MEVRVETLGSMRYSGILGPGYGIGVEDPMLAPPPELQSLVENKQKPGRSFFPFVGCHYTSANQTGWRHVNAMAARIPMGRAGKGTEGELCSR